MKRLCAPEVAAWPAACHVHGVRRLERFKEEGMASPMVAISTSTPAHFAPFADSQVKANSPYGLPIVENCQNCKLRNGNYFCSLSDPLMKTVDQIKHSSSYPEGALVFMEGQASRGVYIICQGKVKLMT